MALINMEAACYTSSSPIISFFSFNTRADMGANCGRLEAAHSESRSHLKIHLYCGWSILVLATENVPAKQKQPARREKMNLWMVFLIHTILYCSGRRKAFEPGALEPVWKTRSSCSRRRIFDIWWTFDIWYVHSGCGKFMSPGALLHTLASILLNGNHLRQK